MRLLLFMSGTRTIIMGWWIIFPSHSQRIFTLNSSVYDHQDLKFTHASPICTRVIFVPAQDVGLSSAFSNKRRFEEKKGMKSPGWSTSRTDLAVQQHFYYQRRVLIGKLKPLSYNLHLFTKTQRLSLTVPGTSTFFLLIWRQTQVTAFGFFSYYWLWENTLFLNTTHYFNILVNSCKIF